jgi:topoisomerase-4 subunit B
MKRPKKKATYGDDAITHLTGLDPVREIPGMYVGDVTSDYGTFQIIKEVVYNSLDEYLAGYANKVEIVLDLKTGQVAVVDNGRGIPLKSIVNVFTNLHSGGKFKGTDTYKVSSGLHGVGVSCTNALSTDLSCYSKRGIKIVGAKFKCGKVVSGEKKYKKIPTLPILKKNTSAYSKRRESGTVLVFTPDWEILTYGKLPAKRVLKWLALLPRLCPGLKINISILSGKKSMNKTFYSKKGLEGMSRASDFYCKNGILECLAYFLPGEDRILEGYVNTIPIQEGSHIKAFWSALKKAITPHAKKRADVPKTSSLRESVAGILHVKFKNPNFTGQTKEKLGDDRVEKKVYGVLSEEFRVFFKKKPRIAKKIIHQAKQLAKLDLERKSKIKALKSLDKDSRKGRLPVALAVSETRKAKERELFIVEGESAGGGCKTARDREYQEVLPLGGKPANAERKNITALLKKKDSEIKDIMLSIGGDDPEEGRVGKVIFLSDSDPDGSHITSLLITCFLKLFPDWVREGRVYTVDTPLFHMIHKGKRYFGNTAKEVLKQTGGKGNVMRVKGWGEMRPNDLEYIAFNATTRKLIKLKVSNSSYKSALKLMGDDTGIRKQLLKLDDK